MTDIVDRAGVVEPLAVAVTAAASIGRLGTVLGSVPVERIAEALRLVPELAAEVRTLRAQKKEDSSDV
ncbi:hypothetical protein [Mycolicibacterium austroafricanum]|uniref:hypothetical protein n=1 Tax=Mycolicibacterium austroafricanum TaxID=39687 RepID=UPI001CA33908|nr:hypothetical protein [Mycolicibacterium austroafricanum]QZT61285.1 hypothetical protein JN085_20165 [Mycolicibacterium austroafricanum]